MILFLLACENPTPPDPPHCAGATHEGDAVASELAPDVRWVTGSLVLDDSTGVCGVGGDLEVHPDGAAPELSEVRGALRVAGGTLRVGLPALQQLGALSLHSETLQELALPALVELGPTELRGMSALESLDLSAVEGVGGRFVAIDLPLLAELSLEPLQEVEGPFVLRRVGIASLVLPEEARFEGGLELDDLPGLAGVAGCGGCASSGPIRVSGVAGPVVTVFSAIESAQAVELLDLPMLEQLEAFGALRHVDGVLRVDTLGPVEQLDLFGSVETVGGSVVVEAFRGQRVVGFPSLREVGGLLEVSHNPSLEEIRVGQVTHVESLVLHDNPVLPGLPAMPQLQELGTVEVYDNAVLSSIAGLQGTQNLNGGLRLERLPMLTDLTPLAALQTIEGDLRVVDIGLPREQVEAFFSEVVVSGTVRFE